MRETVAVIDEFGDLRPMEAIEKDVLVLALQKCKGKAQLTARRLMIGRSTLYRKITEYRIDLEGICE